MFRMPLLVLVLAMANCRGADITSGPPESYILLLPSSDPAAFRPAEIKNPDVQPLPQLLESGFTSEMLRTVYLAAQFIRDGIVDGRPFSKHAIAQASHPVSIVIGKAVLPFGRGLTVEGTFFSNSRSYPDLAWIGLPAELSRDKALIQTMTGRLASYAAWLVASAGQMDTTQEIPQVLIEGYRMAMEVVAREWRFGTGPAGVIQLEEGTREQRELFANIRENRYVLDEGTKTLRKPEEILASPGVAATIIYRMAQSRAIGHKVARESFYAPYAKGRMPPKVNPAAILGPFRNFQAKFLGCWATSVLQGKAPKTILDLVVDYGKTFPAEQHEAIRVAIVTTFGATVKAGGVPTSPNESSKALALLTVLTAEVVMGKRSIVSALEGGNSPNVGGSAEE
jgi:hypothetical protein